MFDRMVLLTCVDVVRWLVLVLAVQTAVMADYQCLCSSHTSRTVYASINGNSPPVGYLYQSECKEFLGKTADGKWAGIVFAHQRGYVKLDYLTTETMCTGDSPVGDRLTAGTGPVGSTTTPSPTTTIPTLTTTQTTTSVTGTSTSTQLPSSTSVQTQAPTQTTPSVPTTSTSTSPSSSQPTSGMVFPTTQKTILSTASTTPSVATSASGFTTTPLLITYPPSTTSTTKAPQTPVVHITTHTPTHVPIDNTGLCPPLVVYHSRQAGTVLGQFGNKCYELFPRKRYNWLTTLNLCRQGHGSLVSIESLDEQMYVGSLVQKHARHSGAWLGLNDIQVEGHLQWSSGARVTYSHLHQSTNELVWHNSKDCFFLLADSGDWHASNCYEAQNVLCQFGINSQAPLVG